jgi:hypothetical protein
MQKESDPKLKEAMEEIKVILKKHDCLGTILLCSPTHTEYLFHIASSWSVMKFERIDNNTVHVIRFRSKKEDFASEADQHFATESTVHFLTSTLQFGQMIQKNMEGMLKELRTKMKIAYQVWRS